MIWLKVSEKKLFLPPPVFSILEHMLLINQIHFRGLVSKLIRCREKSKDGNFVYKKLQQNTTATASIISLFIMSEKVEGFNKEQCVKWLKEIGQSSGGTLEELRNKIKMYLRYSKLTNKLKAKANMYYRFKCSLNPLEIPIITAKWSSN